MSYSSHCFCFHKLTQSKTSDETQSCSAVCAVYPSISIMTPSSPGCLEAERSLCELTVLLMLKLTVCWDEPYWIKPAPFWLILADVILPVEVFSCRKTKSKLVLRSWLYVTRTWVHKFHHQTLMTSIRVDVHMFACFFFFYRTDSQNLHNSAPTTRVPGGRLQAAFTGV